jgi:hypothetical protein
MKYLKLLLFFLSFTIISYGHNLCNKYSNGVPVIPDSLTGAFNTAEAVIRMPEVTFTYTKDNCSYQETITIGANTKRMFENITIDYSDHETTEESDCLTYAGTLDLAVANLCGLPNIEVIHNGDDFLEEDDILNFVLYSNSLQILKVSDIPSFDLAANLEEGVVYYVSAAAGNPSVYGIVNFNDPCLSLSAPQPVVFGEAVDLTVSQDTFICSGDDYQLEATVNNADLIVWAPTSGLSCFFCPDPVATPSVTTTYTITAYNAAGCTEQTNVTIYVDEIQNFLPNESIAVCPGEYVDICLPDALAYEWNGPNSYFSVDQCLVWPDFDPVYDGIYTIEMQISPNCTITDQLELFVPAEQTVNFLTSDLATCPNEMFTLSADIEGAVSYRWSPNENVTDSETATTNAYMTEPTVFVLQTFDQYGCEAIFTVDVTNETDCEIDGEIPLGDFTNGNSTQRLALHKNNIATSIRIYPNPSTSLFNITSPSIIQTIEVFHVNGQLIDQYQPNESTYPVDAQHWQAGTYLIRIKDQNGIHHQRVVKIQE